MSQFEQRANIKFICRWEKSASETLSALQQVYGDTALTKSAVYDWFSRFKKAQEALEDDQRIGRPSTSRTKEMTEKVRKMWWKNDHRGAGTRSWHLSQIHSCNSVRRFEDEACQCEVCSEAADHGSDGMSHDGRWRSVWEKYAGPNVSHKDCHWWWVMDIRLRPGDEDAVSRLAHSVVSPTKKNHASSNPRKNDAHAFFDIGGVVHHEFASPGQTANGHFYVQVLQRLRDGVRRKWRDKW